jgi:uncharacterized protein (TIGR01244 family)
MSLCKNFMTRVTTSRAFILIAWTVFVSGFAGAAMSGEPTPEARLPNAWYPEPNRIASGALDEETIGKLRKAGIKHVINLRTMQEMAGFDEAAALAAQGITYSHLPITAETLDKEHARKLDELLEQAGSEPTLVHCASGNRVGALIALRAAWIHGRPTEEAIEEGRRWGLAGLENKVRALLEQ